MKNFKIGERVVVIANLDELMCEGIPETYSIDMIYCEVVITNINKNKKYSNNCHYEISGGWWLKKEFLQKKNKPINLKTK